MQSMIAMKFSYPTAFSLSLAFRFIPTIATETEIIIDAQKSRGHRIEEGGIFQQIRNLFPLIIPLLLNSIRRAYNVAEALESRGFDSEKAHTFYFPLHFEKKDLLFIILNLALLIGGIIVFFSIQSVPLSLLNLSI